MQIPNHQQVQNVGQDRPMNRAVDAYDQANGTYSDNVVGNKPPPAMKEPVQTPRFVTTGT